MSDSTQDQQPADDETIAKAEEANRVAAEHGVADAGGLPGGMNTEDEPPVDRPGSLPADRGSAGGSFEEKIDDVVQELGPPQ